MFERSPHRLALVAALALGCNGTQGLREWRPEDHDSGVSSAGGGDRSASNDDPLVGARGLFAAQCASCHGAEGRGDGPMAAMFRPADLSDPTLQSQRTDAQLAEAITRGKGRMPAFGSQLRAEAVPLLVQLIRSWRR